MRDRWRHLQRVRSGGHVLFERCLHVRGFLMYERLLHLGRDV